MNNQINSPPKRVALYLRLSKEDLDKITKEDISQSIKNQKLMLLNEVKKHKDWQITGIYCDEDFSGAGTYRPEFENMIKSCENREIDIVLCKSQSRFSRDMEIIEKYLHNKFTEWNIRFISLVDNADTDNKGNKKSRQINALVNEWFLEDLSNNIKTTLRTKWKSGQCTSSFAKYGLMKDKNNKNHLLIDPIASEVLKQIGALFLKGYGQDKIAEILEQNKIPSPYEYKLLNGSKLKLPIKKTYNNQTISTKGTYIIKITIYNNYNQILNNIKTIYKIIPHNTHHNIKITLKSISNNINLYYTNKLPKDINKININNIDFNTHIWKNLNPFDSISNNYTIGSIFSSLDRLNELSFELEVTITKNDSYKLFINSQKINNTNIKLTSEIRKKSRWSGKVIYNMLRDETYNGTLIQGKTKRISYKNHKCIKLDKSQWIRKENALEKIFDDYTWKCIQEKLSKKTRTSSNGIKHIFSGKVYCNICNNILHKNSSSNKTGTKTEYLLCKDKQNKWHTCNNKKSIKLTTLQNIILNELNKLLKQYIDYNYLQEKYIENINNNIFKSKEDILIKEKHTLNLTIEKKNTIFKQLYEDKLSNIIDNNDFKTLRTKYKEEINKLKERISIIDKELTIISTKKEYLTTSNNLLLNYYPIKTLTPELVNIFIDRIKIDKLNEQTHTRKIIIIWNI